MAPTRRRWPRLVGIAALVALLVGVAGFLAIGRAIEGETVDTSDPFFVSMRMRGEFLPWNHIPPGLPASGRGVPCVGFRMPLANSTRFDLIISKPPAGSATAMQLQVAMLQSRRSGPGLLGGRRWSTQYWLGVPRLLCDLDEAQAGQVLRSGVPPSLEDALLQATARIQWTGGFTPPGTPDIRMDPAPHFSAR